MFTQKHYIVTAQVFRQLRKKIKGKVRLEVLSHVIGDFEEMFVYDNPRFSTIKFEKAIFKEDKKNETV